MLHIRDDSKDIVDMDSTRKNCVKRLSTLVHGGQKFMTKELFRLSKNSGKKSLGGNCNERSGVCTQVINLKIRRRIAVKSAQFNLINYKV